VVLDTNVTIAFVINAVPLATPVSTDPDDDAILACALAARAAAVVSGDDDLLALRDFQDIPILTASALLARLNPS
jgi:predicted nucleic acid-binding protein